jgi:hypothetical protein
MHALWDRLSSLITRRHPDVIVEGPHALRFVLVTGGEQPTRIGIRAHGSVAYGEEVVVIAADLGPATRIDPTVALAVNAILVHGALAVAVEDGVLYLRTAITAGDEHAEAVLERKIGRLAAEALELKRRLAPPTIDPAAFAHASE